MRLPHEAGGRMRLPQLILVKLAIVNDITITDVR
jgi:hypothetical protein